MVAELDFDGSFGVDFDVSIEAHAELMAEFTADLAVQMSLSGLDSEGKFDLEERFNEPGFELIVNKDKENQITYTEAKTLCEDVLLLMEKEINVSETMGEAMFNGAAGLKANSSLNEVASIYIAMKTEYEDIKNPELAGSLPSPEKGLVYFDRVERKKVAA